MGKLSSYEYPDYSLYDSLELAELINDTYSGSVSRSVLSDALNMSTFGGAFASKLAAARLWGLIVGRGNIQLSYHAKNLINLHSQDFSSYTSISFYHKIPIFNQILLETKSNIITKDILGPFLHKITNIEPEIIKKKLPVITKVYNSTFSNVSLNILLDKRNFSDLFISSTDRNSLSSPIDSSKNQRLSSDQNSIDISYPGVNVSLPINSENLEISISLLTSFLKSIKDD